MSDPQKPSLFGRLKKAAGDLASEYLASIPMEVRKHFQVDIAGKNFRISHEMFTAGVRAAASRSDQVEITELQPEAGAYKLTAQVGGREVVTKFRIESVTWTDGLVVVLLSVPEGIKITASPVLNFIAAGICMIFGGTTVGESILSAKLPPNVCWDGRTIRWTSQLSPDHEVPGWLGRGEPVVLTATHEKEGIRFRVDADVKTLVLLVALVGKQVAKWAQEQRKTSGCNRSQIGDSPG